jgi:hypothetical protein
MTTATDTDIQQLKDLITAGNIATQKQVTDGNAVMQKQITDGNAAMQKQIADLALNSQQQISKLEQRMEVGFANVETKFTKIEGDIATLSTEVKNFEKSMTEMKSDQRAQDQRFFGLSIFIITFAVGVAAKLAKLY